MPPKTEEIAAVFLRERYRREDFVIAEVRPINGSGDADSLFSSGLSVKGTAEVGELEPGLEYRFYGHREKHPKYGKSFAFKTFILSEPHERRGVIAYLQKAPHVGPITAEAFWRKFKSQAVRVLRETPEIAVAALASNSRFTHEKAQEAAAELRRLAATEDATIDLIGLLSGRGFPKATAKEAIAAWGNRAAKLVERNPYLLMAFRGCGFLKTDAMYLDLGFPPARLKRQALCAWHAIATDSEGHTWYPVEMLAEAIRQKVAGAFVCPTKACRLAKRAGMIAFRKDTEGRIWAAEGKKARAEEYVARKVAEAVKELAKWPDAVGLDGPTIHQTTALALSFTGPIGILGGAPGTGKTFTAAAAVRVITRLFGVADVAVCAPTGKAAVRVGEAMQSYGLDLEATTIHRLLGVKSLEGGNWTFCHNEMQPLPHRFIVVDEASMVDLGLMAHLLAARARGTHILFVGDVNQLPPVGHGAPLRDLIRAGVPYGELTEICRNAGSIVRVCHAMKDGKPWQPDQRLDPDAYDPVNLALVPAANGKEAVEQIVSLIRKIAAAGLADPVWGIQVICAVNRKSDLSRRALNGRLQAELNPAERVAGSPFRLHDKVIQLKNGFLPAANEGEGDDSGKFFVANGEQGQVVVVQERLTVVKLSGPERLVKVPRGKSEDSKGDSGKVDDDESTGTGCDIDLAYAISCHKSQGSEWPIVIVALDEYPGARRVCSREWLYTAISRAKKCCFLVGKLSTAHGMCRRVALSKRKTFLWELIVGQTRADV